MVKLAVRAERCQRLSLCLVKQIFFFCVSRHNEHARTVCANSTVADHVVLSRSPSERGAVTSDFGVIMPSVDDDVAGLLLTRHVLYI